MTKERPLRSTDSDWENVTLSTVESDGLSTAMIGLTFGDSQSTTVLSETEDGSVEIQLSIVWAN
jgi:hypothetical protein